jgi:hypothetical protein
MIIPPWALQADVQQLLNLLIDRLESAEQRNKQLVRPIKLDERSFPPLYRAEFESEREAAWTNVERLARAGWIALTLDRARPGTAPYELSPRVTILDVASIRAVTGRAARVRSSTELWYEAVDSTLKAPNAVKEIVKRHLITVPGRPAAEVVARLDALRSLADTSLMLREVSAQLFWNQSKVLDNRQGLVAAILGLDECPFPDMPVQLLVALPTQPLTGVLFVENQTTFECASRDNGERYTGLALAFSYGFKASAKRLRRPEGVSLYFAAHGDQCLATRDAFTAWLFGASALPNWFWGDLDHAGMGILAAMRVPFPTLGAWRPGYEPMVALLDNGQGHDPEQAGKQAQQPVERTGCEYADQVLIPAIAKHLRFVDQEAVYV